MKEEIEMVIKVTRIRAEAWRQVWAAEVKAVELRKHANTIEKVWQEQWKTKWEKVCQNPSQP